MLLWKGWIIMDKYLDEIRSYLGVLDKSIVDKEIANIKTVLEQNMNGKSFEDLALVSALDQAKEILKSYGVNSEIVLQKENYFKRKGKELIDGFVHLFDIKNNFKANLKIVFDIIVLFVFISLVKIPFIAIRNIGESLLNNINFALAYDIWGIAIEFVYIVVAIMIFINVFPRWYKNLKVVPKDDKPKKVVSEVKSMGNDLESISLSDNDNK